MDADHRRQLRDRRIRRRLLDVLHASRAYGDGRVSGGMLHECAQAGPAGEQPEDEAHTLRLLRDLVLGQYAVEHDTRRYRHERLELASLAFAVTAKGAALAEEAIAADPLIHDRRLPQ